MLMEMWKLAFRNTTTREWILGWLKPFTTISVLHGLSSLSLLLFWYYFLPGFRPTTLFPVINIYICIGLIVTCVFFSCLVCMIRQIKMYTLLSCMAGFHACNIISLFLPMSLLWSIISAIFFVFSFIDQDHT